MLQKNSSKSYQKQICTNIIKRFFYECFMIKCLGFFHYQSERDIRFLLTSVFCIKIAKKCSWTIFLKNHCCWYYSKEQVHNVSLIFDKLCKLQQPFAIFSRFIDEWRYVLCTYLHFTYVSKVQRVDSSPWKVRFCSIWSSLKNCNLCLGIPHIV